MTEINFYTDTIGFKNSRLMPIPKLNVIRNFGVGIKLVGDNFNILNTYGDPVDYALILGAIPIIITDIDLENKTLKKVTRYKIIEAQKKINKKVIVIESGLLGKAYNADTVDIKVGSCRVGLNHNLPNFANFKNKNSPSDRWEQLVSVQGLELKPWRTKGDNILICLQRRGSFAVRDIDQIQWMLNIVKELKKYTDRKILVRTKDRHLNDQIRSLDVEISNEDDDMYTAWAAIVMSSTIDIKLVLSGIPVFTMTNRAFTYPLGNHELSNIEDPILANRKQFFYDLAYAQWTIEEMREGLAWNHIKD